MRFLANENVPRLAIEALRGAGHDVAWVRMDDPGASDERVLARSQVESRVLLTLDKDFGELVLKRGRDASHGVILIRTVGTSPADLVRLVLTAIGERDDWAGCFSVIEKDRTRIRPLVHLAVHDRDR